MNGSGDHLKGMSDREFSFDVFLCHSSRDKPVVRELGEKLRDLGLRVWLDEWELRPGVPWQEELENAIQTVRAAAILYGPSGTGPWADREMRAFLSEFVDRKAPVIPVLLPGAPTEPKLPLFLKAFTWVDLRGGLTSSGLDRVAWGVTGNRWLRSRSAAAENAVGAPPLLSSLTSIRKFREEYLVADPGAPPVPFGGRDRELGELDTWLDKEEAPRRFLITAPAGRGKSALLVRWLERLQEREPESALSRCTRRQTVFVPISIRFGTNLPENYLRALAERLALIAGKALQPPAVDPVGFYTDQVQNLLQKLDDDGTPLLVVVDGLDEALREFNPDLFPRRLSGNVRILVSARVQLGDVDGTGWRDRLQWRSSQPCGFLELAPLDTSGIRDVLEKMGAPVNELAGSQWTVQRLLELTQGDPLLVGYYAEDLWGLASNVGTRVTKEDLETLKPGFGEYFSRWLKHQEKAWKEGGNQLDRESVDAVLMTLSFAYGPLEATDVVAVLQHVPKTREVFHMQRVLEPLRRFVIGNGQPKYGYVLAHPKIGEHLQRERFASEAPWVNRGFVEWGRETVARVNDDLSQCERVPTYLVQFYRRHLEDADAPLNDFMALVEDGWRRSWEHYEGSQRGFAGDVSAAWSRARPSGPLSELGAQLRCVMTLSSIRSVGQNVPGELLFHAVKAGVLTVGQAEHLVRFMGNEQGRAVTLGRIAAEFERGADLRFRLLEEALADAQAIRNESHRASALSALALHLPPDLLSKAVAAAQAIGDEYYRAEALAALAPHLPAEQRQRVLSEALEAAQAVGHEYYRAEALGALAPHLPPELLSEALARAQAIGNESWRAKALSGFASHLAPELRQRVLTEALSAAQAIGDESSRAEALSALAPHLPPELLPKALAAAQGMGEEQHRAQALSALAPHLPAELLQPVLNVALVPGRTVGGEYHRLRALSALGPRLSPELLPAAVHAFDSKSSQARVLSALAPHLPPELISQALAAAQAVGDEYVRVLALNAMAPRLPPEQRRRVLSEALEAAQAIGDESSRARALSDLAPRRRVLSEALEAAQAIGAESSRAYALSDLAPHLPPDQLSRALETAQAIGDESSRARALSALAPRLPPGQRRRVLSEALQTAQAIGDESSRAYALSDLAPHLPSELLADALVALLEISERMTRSKLLVSLTPFAGAIQAQGGDALSELARAILDTARWYP